PFSMAACTLNLSTSRQCFNVNLEGDLLKSCGDRLIIVRLPNDSTDDYEFDDAMDGWSEYSYYSDLDYDNELDLL
ncbi:hypothetical protein MKX03_014233, partial [Papaver bracteatum]